MRTHRHALALCAILALPALLTGCPAIMRGGSAGGRGGGGGGGSLGSQCRGDFGTTNAAAKIEAFLIAASDFAEAASSVENDLLAACQRMGRALGMSDADLRSTGGPEGVRTVCEAVNERFRAEMQATRGAAQVRVEIETRPPHCEVSMNAYASCAAECEARVDPGSVEIQCEGGEIRGHCSAECRGSCSASVSGRCEGTCEGICEGRCAQSGPDGSCAGQCDGECQGQCVVRARASCEGECRGSCSVEFEEPYCTGEVRPASVSARCRAACEARVEAHARCEPGEARMNVSGGIDPAMRPRVEALQNAVREGLGAILALRTKVERLQRSGRQIARLAPDLPNAAATVGIGAVACATAASGAIVDSMASVSVSVEVSVSISASASASASSR